MGANMRSLNNDADCLHEKLVLDIGAYVTWLKEGGTEKIVLLGNSGGGSLFSFYQGQAKAAPAQRIMKTPGGRRTLLEKADLIPGDAMIYMAAHVGQGLIINQVIDPAAIDEGDPFKTDPNLDMYDPRNGFNPAPAWTAYAPEFVARYRQAQLGRVRRIDGMAHDFLAAQRRAAALHGTEYFDDLPADVRRDALQWETFEAVMVVYRTLANLNYTDNSPGPFKSRLRLVDQSPSGHQEFSARRLRPHPDTGGLALHLVGAVLQRKYREIRSCGKRTGVGDRGRTGPGCLSQGARPAYFEFHRRHGRRSLDIPRRFALF
jgi:hypothetical protein